MTEPEVVKELEDISALFVQTAHAVESSDGRIILKRVTPSTIYFSDRPQRKADGCSLFIDPIGRPLSPVSVNGRHGRHRRDGRRDRDWTLRPD